MAQLQCSDIKMGCSDTVLFRAYRKKFRGNIARYRSAFGHQRSAGVIITSKSLPVCANCKRRQAYIPWALARTRAQYLVGGDEWLSSPGRLRAVSVPRTFHMH